MPPEGSKDGRRGWGVFGLSSQLICDLVHQSASSQYRASDNLLSRGIALEDHGTYDSSPTTSQSN